ncbi:MAG: cyclopropane-fatty-acyl-phospholipid synthase family protein [Spirochaetia bacterium]|jgi:cyclopropane-fatty-acyl-phospholipid synthase|nr:cyclopropane-fatty-acyl-phospholipid synthase family protein [Spirochaetia bacterium]
MIDSLLSKGILPDPLVRLGVRRLTKNTIHSIEKMDVAEKEEYLMRFIRERSHGPIAIKTIDANEQHYEMPSEFFELVLGRHKKYSCAYWEQGDSLDDAEKRMLELVCLRAGIEDGQRILELGCGWGSFCIYAAMRFPHTRITAVSNSNNQRSYIEEIIKQRDIKNLQVITCDINELALTETFDRVVSIEMFEHMRNYETLFGNVAGFLNEKGKLFVHVFCHRNFPYTYEEKNSKDWMAKYFFTGGTMPSQDLFHFFNHHVRISQQWAVNGKHYQKTLEAWLKKMDQQKNAVMPILARREGEREAVKWWSYWRVFFMACAEFFAINGGNEYFVAHYLFEKNS